MTIKKPVKILLPLLLFLGVAAATYHWWHGRQVSNDDTTLTLHGNVDIREVDLAFNGAERIAEMLVQEGDTVTKGQLLATLDKRRLQHAVDLAAAQATAQREVLARLKAGSRPEEIRQAQAAADAAHIAADNAERNSQRQAELVKQKLVPQEQADNAQATAEAAAAQARAADETLRLARLGPRKEDIAAAQATLQAAEAQLALAQRQLADAELTAPAAGVIEQRLLEPGDMASPQRPVFTLALNDPLWVRAYVGETDLGKLHPGMAATVHSDSFPDKSYDGWIGFISPTAEFTPKSVETKEVRTNLVYQVRIFVCNTQNQLRLGMPVTATVQLNQASNNNTTNCGGQ
jgi:HlyD family secretion protein